MTPARVSADPQASCSVQGARARDARQLAAAGRFRRPTNLIPGDATLCARHGTLRQRLTGSCAATMKIAATSLHGRRGSTTTANPACDAVTRRTAPFTRRDPCASDPTRSAVLTQIMNLSEYHKISFSAPQTRLLSIAERSVLNVHLVVFPTGRPLSLSTSLADAPIIT